MSVQQTISCTISDSVHLRKGILAIERLSKEMAEMTIKLEPVECFNSDDGIPSKCIVKTEIHDIKIYEGPAPDGTPEDQGDLDCPAEYDKVVKTEPLELELDSKASNEEGFSFQGNDKDYCKTEIMAFSDVIDSNAQEDECCNARLNTQSCNHDDELHLKNSNPKRPRNDAFEGSNSLSVKKCRYQRKKDRLKGGNFGRKDVSRQFLAAEKTRYLLERLVHPPEALKRLDTNDSEEDYLEFLSDESESDGDCKNANYSCKLSTSLCCARPGNDVDSPHSSVTTGRTINRTHPCLLPFKGDPGLKLFSTPSSPLTFVQLFITRDLLEYFVIETNRYAAHCHAAQSAKECKWSGIQIGDMARYLGLAILMGIVKLPHLKMYWQEGRLFSIPSFSHAMSFEKFSTINRMFHTYNSRGIPSDSVDRLLRIRTVVEYFNKMSRAAYTPERDLSVNEKGMVWKDELAHGARSPRMLKKCPFKCFIVAESQSGYAYSFEVYSGAKETASDTLDTILNLLDSLRDRGYMLYIDSCNNSLTLAEQLLSHGFHMCGPLRAAEDVLPSVSVHLSGKKRLTQYVSTVHNVADGTIKFPVNRQSQGFLNTSCREGKISVALTDYASSIGAVHQYDQMVQIFPCGSQFPKWTQKIVIYLLHVAIHNAYILYRKYSPEAKAKETSLNDFHEVVYRALICFNSGEWPLQGHVIPHAPDLVRDEDDANPNFLNGGRLDQESHAVFSLLSRRRPRVVDPEYRLRQDLDHSLTSMVKRRRCRVCTKKGARKDTKYMCTTCQIALCPTCVYVYHQKKEYWEK